MVTTQPSLLDLTSRLPDHIGREVSQATFRPNMVVTGAGLVAWQEDGWVGEVRLGESVVLTYSKDCTRCTATKVRAGTETDGEKVWFEDQSRDWRTLRSERASRHSEEVPATRSQSQDHQESCRGQSHLRDALHHVVPGYVHRPPLRGSPRSGCSGKIRVGDGVWVRNTGRITDQGTETWLERFLNYIQT